jgi:hypothetical protein
MYQSIVSIPATKEVLPTWNHTNFINNFSEELVDVIWETNQVKKRIQYNNISLSSNTRKSFDIFMNRIKWKIEVKNYSSNNEYRNVLNALSEWQSKLPKWVGSTKTEFDKSVYQDKADIIRSIMNDINNRGLKGRKYNRHIDYSSWRPIPAIWIQQWNSCNSLRKYHFLPSSPIVPIYLWDQYPSS